MIPQKKLLDMYRTMVRIRTFENRVSQEFAAGNTARFHEGIDIGAGH